MTNVFTEPGHGLLGVLRIPCLGNDWCSQNQRLHWGARAARTKAWRDMTLIQARHQSFPKGLPPAIIVPTFVFETNRRRDRGNFTATSKAIIDALCTGPKPPHGWGSWPDDDDRYIEERMPVLTYNPLSPGDGVIIRAYRRYPPPESTT